MLTINLGVTEKAGVNLLVNGVSYVDCIPYTVRVKLLGNATKKLNSDIERLSYINKDSEEGAFYWLFTKEWIRTDDIRGVWRLWFIIEILNYLSQDSKENILFLSRGIPKIYREIIKNSINGYTEIIVENSSLNRKTIFRIAKNIGRSLQPLLLVTKLISSPQKIKSDVLVETELNFNGNRYGTLESLLKYSKELTYFTLRYGKVYGCENESIIKPQNELNLQILSKSIKKLLNNSRIKNKKEYFEIDSFKASFYSHGGYLGFLEKIIFYYCLDSLLKKSKLNLIVTVSSFHRPDTRLVWYLANKNHIKTVNVAPRTFNFEKPSEQLIKSDISFLSKKTLADNFIFRDTFSYKSIQRFEEDIANVQFAQRYLNQDNTKIGCDSNQEEKRNILIILLGTETIPNKLMVKSLQLNNVHQEYNKVYIRQHPKFIDNELLKGLDHQFGDITNKPMDHLFSNNNCTLLTISSTAALEGGALGGLIVWAPFYSDNSIISDSLYKHVGFTAESEHELSSILKAISVYSESEFQKAYINKMNNISDFRAFDTIDNALCSIYQKTESIN